MEVGVDGGEGGEVVGAEDMGGGLLEEAEVERDWAGPDEVRKHGGADAALRKDAVLVGLAKSAVAGVEVLGCGFDGEDADAGGKGAIEGAMKIFCGNGDVEGEGGYLGEGVDAGVSAARALGKDGFAGDAMDGLRESSLDSGKGGLDLPAAVGSAVVGEDGLPEGHKADGFEFDSCRCDSSRRVIGDLQQRCSDE